MAQHPTEESMNITRKFLGGERGVPGQPPGGGQAQQLPSQAAPVAGQQAFGQQGARQSGRGPQRKRVVPGPQPPQRFPGGSLSDNYFDLPGPVGFAQTPQGKAILQRLLGGVR